MSSLGGINLRHLRLEWPAYGQATVEVRAEKPAPGGRIDLVVKDLTFAVTVLPGRSGDDAPGEWHGLARAGAGWMTKLGAERSSYGTGTPIKLSTVLNDLARDCGELIALPPDKTIGPSWARPVSLPRLPFRGRDALALLRERGDTGPWYVDTDGVTRWGIRPAKAAPAAKAQILGRDLAAGWRKFSTETPAAFAPGSTFDGITIARLVITEDAGALTCEAWAS